MSEGPYIVDTVVLVYFLLVAQEGLLCDLLGRPLQVPLAVYDPEDRELLTATSARSELLSEMRQSVRYYETSATLAAESELPDHAIESHARIKRVDDLYDDGRLVTVAMTPQEQVLAAQLQGSEAAGHGLKFRLAAGEAACVAISYERGWTIATDDADALKVLSRLHNGQEYPYERIRKLLIRAADEGCISREDANRLHDEMRSLGFWDSSQPFD
ncbi:hypothetical protein [Candidatus Poriferisodalis sp.]|uniref:hypothetical protein n=1 Tax=Candidatus Poriferisodalis sp. TaxID=3101277 RepID=UPI003B528522